MSLVNPSPPPEQRPALHRSLSHTNPSNKNENASSQPQTAEPSARPARPPHIRSRSYLSPADPKPRNAITLPTATSAFEKTASRLHLPGTSHRHHHNKDKDHNSGGHQPSQSHSHILHHNNDSTHSLPFRRHRPSQSDAHTPRRFASKEALSTLPHLVAGLNAERDRRAHTGNVPNPINPTNRSAGGGSGSNGTAQHVFGPSAAMTSDFQAGGRYDYNTSGYPELRRRATSDPASRDRIPHAAPAHPLRPKTSFEEALDRGDAARVARRIHVKVEDLQRRDQELREGEEELRSRVAEITATGVEITRRLDYGYYNLLEKVGNLVSMIGSFQSLARQSGTLIGNFERESKRVDEDTRRRVKTLQSGFETRQVKARQLTERGKKASDRARDLSARLETARAKVEEWENREEKFRKAWDRVWGIVWWTSIAVIVIVVAVVLGKEWYFHGDPVKAGLRQHGEGNWNRSLRLGGRAGGEENERLLRFSEGDSGGSSGTVSGEKNDTDTEGKKRLNVPDDVRQLLLGIAERNRIRKDAFPEIPSMVHGRTSSSRLLATSPEEDQCREDPRLASLDEL
ncbi:uncharacterized protein Z520_05420 [Fonsecaea multimorphosa CBS 102226]|uniref:Uncharacterized protein n=1 Tax=Fonsecaea multimorphosa CBS 102226 TaxID=1442371 RepID=A0A0D2K745_9EURO|nr:uncharacterized protein Z520_05420 [Fonsecaea multimorphosa CBS 102226]KIX98959.1 hypothetical protein Z520_05420 [Fonsecaea multimorphosa CBS 102226]OAL25232.1 hypothetical protein AYO22_05109 [Fonsecaea multimorphosa]